MTELQKIAYRIQIRSFFDELHKIEKEAMVNGTDQLVKESMGFGGKAIKGFSKLINKGSDKALQDIGSAYSKGKSKALHLRIPKLVSKREG